MRKFVACASIVVFSLACSPSRTHDFKKSPQQENIMPDSSHLRPSPLIQSYVFGNGYMLWEDKHGNIAIRNGDGELLFSGRLVKRIDVGRIIFESDSGNTFQTEKNGNILMCPLDVPDKPSRNLNVK